MEQRTSTYEVMFLITQAVAADFAGAIEHINHLLSRAGAETLAMCKWDERRLAYEINKQRRGVYILAYIKAPHQSIQGLQRDCNLSEKILRVLITGADHLSREEVASFDGRDKMLAEARLRAERPQPSEYAGAGVAEDSAPAENPEMN